METAREYKEVCYSEYQWSFRSGLRYCFALLSTVGYGDFIPHTQPGKIFTFFYMILGEFFFVSSRLINPYWRILGHEWDHFTGKPTQSWILEFLGKTQADFWITNPKQSIESKNNILSGNWNLPKRVNHFKIFRNSSVPFGDCTVSNDIEIIYLAR